MARGEQASFVHAKPTYSMVLKQQHGVEKARGYMRTMGCTASMDAGTCFEKNSDLGIYVSDAPSALPNDDKVWGTTPEQDRRKRRMHS